MFIYNQPRCEQACNTVGLYSLALDLFDELRDAENRDEDSLIAPPTSKCSDEALNSIDNDYQRQSPKSATAKRAQTVIAAGEVAEQHGTGAKAAAIGDSGIVRGEAADTIPGDDSTERSEEESGGRSGERGGDDSLANVEVLLRTYSDDDSQGNEEAEIGEGEGDVDMDDPWGRWFGGLQSFPDGELFPAAAAAIALESCALCGQQEKATDIVFQVTTAAAAAGDGVSGGTASRSPRRSSVTINSISDE